RSQEFLGGTSIDHEVERLLASFLILGLVLGPILGLLLTILNELTGNLPADRADLTLEISNACFSRVVLDYRFYAVIGELHLLRLEAVCLRLLADQVAFRDLKLFPLGVSGQPQDFEPVLQSRWNRMQHVGGGDKHDLRQVVLNVEIVIMESMVLLRIKNLEQRSRRIPAEIGAQLVDLVKEDERIDSPGLLHHLDDLARERSNIGPPVASN